MSTTATLSPLVTIIMPIRNEQKAIRKSLSAALSQDYPRDRLEVIVADGMSDDNTREIVKAAANADPRVRLVDNHARIMAAGFNAGVVVARGEIIVMLGGHTEIEPGYVSACVDAIKRRRVDCVGGPIETVCDTANAKAIAAAMSSPFGVGGVAFRTGTSEERYVDTVAFGAYTREVIERAGRLDEELVRNQDDEYNYRLRRLGAKILLDPSIRSTYYSRSSLRSLWRQYFQYGFWKVRVMQKHPLQMRPRHFAPASFVFALLFSALGSAVFPFGVWGLGCLLAAYSAANLIACLLVAREGQWSLLPLLPVTFATLHVSYGLGFLVGLMKFWNRWGDRENRFHHLELRISSPDQA
jgi:glycosyltransferase involved in cell wall biosynthesis